MPGFVLEIPRAPAAQTWRAALAVNALVVPIPGTAKFYHLRKRRPARNMTFLQELLDLTASPGQDLGNSREHGQLSRRL